jgi:hypothetical protein
MARTFILGAGASRHAGYPLASEMGDALLNFMLDSEDLRLRASAECLIDSFGKRSNVEDLITAVQLRIKALENSVNSGERAERMRIANSLGWLSASVREWFRKIQATTALAYADFSKKVVQSGDVVITFNYDDSLERELKKSGKWDLSQGYGYLQGNSAMESSVLMLKLHGSINWLVSLFEGAIAGAFLIDPPNSMGNCPVIHPADSALLGYESFTGRVYRSGAAFPCLVLPGRQKEFFYDTSLGVEYVEFWDHLWRQAAGALRASQHLTICGYSLLPVDERACKLLLENTPKHAQIKIVSGGQSERIANDFRTAGFTEVTCFEGGYFEDWVSRECCGGV